MVRKLQHTKKGLSNIVRLLPRLESCAQHWVRSFRAWASSSVPPLKTSMVNKFVRVQWKRVIGTVERYPYGAAARTAMTIVLAELNSGEARIGCSSMLRSSQPVRSQQHRGCPAFCDRNWEHSLICFLRVRPQVVLCQAGL